MDVSRRQAIVSGALAAAAVAAPALAKAPKRSADSLDSLARRSGRRFGSAVAWSLPGADKGSFANPAYARLLERDCELLVPENELKWQWSRPGPDRFDFRQMDAIADYATSHGFQLRGHTLFWTPTKWYPKWLAETHFASAAEADKLLTTHVETVARRYGKRIYSYDVVNEAVQPETGAIRDTNVTRALGGEHFLDLMFHTAQAEAPHALLVYNDYMSWERTGDDETHMRGVLKLLEGFRKRGTPVDALGVQSHIRLLKRASVGEIVRESERPWREFIDAVTAMGYRLVMTEFDVNDHAAPGDIAVRDRMVADYAKAYLEVMLSYPQLQDILCWGMTDRYSWLEAFDPRADKLAKRGLPYDRNFRAKPMLAATAAAFREAQVSHV